MRLSLFLPLGLLCLAIAAVPAAAQESEAPLPRVLDEAALPGVMARAVDDFIIPGYRDLARSTAALAETIEALCETPSDAPLRAGRSAFTNLVATWSAVEIIRVGPAIKQNRFERFLFYPDRKSTGLKQVQAILAKRDESATDVESLRMKSVAVQGLGALEYVLYGTGSGALAGSEGAFRCRYGRAIAMNLETIADELVAAWERPDGIQAAWKRPGPDNPLFRDKREAATELLGILVHSVEMVKDQRLRPLYAGTIDRKPGRSNPKLAIYWRSGNTMPSLSANFRGLQALFNRAGMEDLLPADSRSIAGSVNFLLKTLASAAGRVDGPLDAALADDKRRAMLAFIALNTADLLDRLNRDFGGAIGLGAGFSFADGD
ncbi:Iron-regulated protein A precursor [Sinorhizobium sojae CCBAU 05684]|uniref:Iron-regulated protein A n=3 Tax=Sinorhizobium sojae TaxID=716925 RepID=A0A249PGL9_9HYPH|nr:imelysin family protein [Sinorhizobium sojae]ASY65068.1 Iron-regulated protein A precursor [Sinorhizobium sojae CCBAU 05684]